MRSFGNNLPIRVDQQADVAGSAGGRAKVLADGPGHGAEIPAFFRSCKDITVFAGRIYLECRYIRPDMAFLAGIWLAGHLDGKGMPRMAGRTGTQAAVKIDTPDALIGPALDHWKFQFSGCSRIPGDPAGYLKLGSMAVVTCLRLR